jgi:hypothetical protein
MKKALRLVFALVLALLPSSCIYLRTTAQTYQATQTAPEVGGARFRAEFIPRGSESSVAVSAMIVGGAAVIENGPYQLRLHAFGRTGEQRWFRVTRFVLTVPGRLNAPMESRAFEGRADFTPAQTGGTRASLLFGTRIHINTDHKDKEVHIEADVEVMQRGSLRRGTIRIPMQLAKKARGESFFVPSEIVRSFRSEKMEDLPAAMPAPPESP